MRVYRKERKWTSASRKKTRIKPKKKVDWQYHNHRKLIYERVKKLKPDSILEVGCNIGGNLDWIREYFPEVKKYGCDINQVEQSKKLFPEFEIWEGNILKLPYNDKSIDVLIVDMVLYLLDDKDVEIAIGECEKVAKKAVIISDTKGSPYCGNPDRFQKYIKASKDFEEVNWSPTDKRFVFTLLV